MDGRPGIPVVITERDSISLTESREELESCDKAPGLELGVKGASLPRDLAG